MLKSVFHYVQSSAIALTAAFAMGVASARAEDIYPDIPDDVTQEDVAELVEMIEVGNADGHKAKIALVYTKKYDTYWEKKLRTVAGIGMASDPNDLDRPLKDFLLNAGFSVQAAFELSGAITNDHNVYHGYLPYAPYPFQEVGTPNHINVLNENYRSPVAYSIDDEPALPEMDYTKPSRYCAISLLTNTHDGQAWARSFINMESTSRIFHLNRDYKKEFSAFILDHEIAHCMGGNEEQADYIAAKFLLKNSQNIKKTLDFLILMRAIRASSVILSQKSQSKYFGTFFAIDKAVDEFKRNGHKVSETDEEIWSYATKRWNYDVWQLSFVRAEVWTGTHRLRAAMKDFKGVASYLRQHPFPDERQRELAYEVAKGLSVLGNIVDDRKKAVPVVPAMRVTPD